MHASARLAKGLVLVLLIGILAASLAACGGQPATPQQQPTAAPGATAVEVATSTPPASAKKVLRIANCEPTQGTSPLTGGTSASMRVWELMHDPLWDRDESYEPIAWLAERWEPNSDSTVWTFYLGKDLTFSDGSPITAEDVKASFEYLKTSELWKGRIEQIKSIEVVDSTTVKFTMTRPMPEFLDLPASQVQFSIFSKKAIEAGADWNQPMQAAYSGPYMLKEYVPKSHLVLVKNPNYWKKGYPKFDEIYWSFNEDATAGVAAVESGVADVYSPVPAKDVPRLRLMSTVAVYEANQASYMGFGFDRSRPPFNDSRVRRAVALILDPEERTDVCWYGTGASLYGGFIFSWQKDFSDGLEPYKKPKADRIAEAKALLDQAGWVEGKDGRRVAKGIQGVDDGAPFVVDVPYEANWPASECHTELLQNWGKEVGMTFNPNRYDPGNFWNDAVAGKFQMWHVGIPGALYAPEGLYQIFHTKGTWNPYWFRGGDAELDKTLDAMAAEPDMAKKKALLAEVNKAVSDETYVVADGSQNTLVLTTAKLKGFFPRSDDSSRALILSEIAAP